MKIQLKNIIKTYKLENKGLFYALNNVTLTFKSQGFYSIVGESGSGKSTLLNVIGNIENPTEGEVFYDNITRYLKKEELYKKISFVFQENNLLSDLSIIENIKIVSSKNPDYWLKKVDLYSKINVAVQNLSGGEKQRLAIVVAIMKNSEVLLLDEPTLNLDKQNVKIILDVLKEISKSKLVIVTTHDNTVIEISDFSYILKKGEVVDFLDYSCLNYYSKDLNEEKILNIYNIIKAKKEKYYIEMKINSSYVDISDSVLEKLVSFSKGENRNISIKFVLKTNISKSENITTKEKSFNFPFVYAYKLIKKNILISFLIIVSLIFSMTSSIFLLNSIFTSSSSVIFNSRKIYDFNIYPLSKKEEGFIPGQYIDIYNGKKYTNELIELVGKQNITTSIDIEINNEKKKKSSAFIPFSLVFFNEYNYKNVLKTDCKYDSEVVYISDFINELFFKDEKEKKLMLSFKNNKFQVENINNNTIKTDYKNLDYDPFNDSINMTKNISKYKYNYGSIYMSEKKFYDLIKNFSISINSSNFLKDSHVLDYLSSFATFKKFSSENIIQGRNIFSKNDIIVSKKFLIENNLKFEDIFDKKISIKNNEEYKNNKFFKYFFNLYEYVKEVKIVGMTDSDQTDFLIHDTLRDNLFWDIHFINSNSTLLISNENFYNNLKKIHSSNNKIIPTFNNLYDSIAFKENVLKKIAIFLTSANLIITVSLILISTMLVIKSKKKEIAILKTYGKKNLNISKIFLYQNIFYILISIPFVVAISLMLNYIFNFLMKKFYINLAYDMINIFPFNYFIVIFSFIVLSIFTVIIPFIKIRKVEIAILKDESF